jgi:hypothetical protein
MRRLRRRATAPPAHDGAKIQRDLARIFTPGSFDTLRVTAPTPAVLTRTVSRDGQVIRSSEVGVGWVACGRVTHPVTGARLDHAFLFDNEGRIARRLPDGAGCAGRPERDFPPVPPDAGAEKLLGFP